MEFQIELGNRNLKVKIENLAEKASGSAFVSYGESTVLSTACLGREREGIDFFPLTCEYQERYYAAGKIRSSRFIKREGRPSEEAILITRMIDRAIRPRFPENFRREIQVIATCLSWDGENDPALLGLLGSSLALGLSNIPWKGPLGAVRIGEKDGQLILNPTYEEREEGNLDIVFAGIKEKGKFLINMIESGSNEVSEATLVQAFRFAEPYLKKLIDFQEEIIKKLGKEKITFQKPSQDKDFKEEIEKFLAKDLEKALYQKDVINSGNDMALLREKLVDMVRQNYGEEKIEGALEIFEEEGDKILRKNVIEKEIRPDGRKLDEIRKLKIRAGVLPRTHGSGLFERGLTKVLSILTLGSPHDQQLLEGMEITGKKRFIHHYNFPPYCAGEVKPLRGPGRREIGHGALAEKALRPVIPSFDDFPYTIRVVSEVLCSNGSTSMASVCGSTLALMDAGVPIKSPVAGISIGIVKSADGAYRLLTDIQGPEDHYGGMDFKVAGTKRGVTAIQMDVKIDGIDETIFKEALERARKARLFILEKMEKVLPVPRKNISRLAPKISILQINPAKIGQLIGPGGKTIQEIGDRFEVEVEVEDSGRVFVTGFKKDNVVRAVEKIKSITQEVEIGKVYEGKVKRLFDFGAMVEIFPGQEGLCHISQFAPYRINNVRDVVRVGETIPVKVIEIDGQGRVNLSAIKAGFKPKHPKVSGNVKGSPSSRFSHYARYKKRS
ncbi:polyribonucleotide nucleotidyltransferase [bacterium]|nr:polyribonucleotide nucleotidyltransferase [bacterium]